MFYFERQTVYLGTALYREEIFGCMRLEESTDWGINEDLHMLLLLA
jgi:hypothetical protein